jgi:hypothetical protein
VTRILKWCAVPTDAKGRQVGAHEDGANRAEIQSGSGLPIRELRGDARALPRGEFAERYGRAFLLLSAADLSTPRPTITEVKLDGDSHPRIESTANLSLIVYPIRRNGHSASHLITVGRAPGNDVVVPT